MAKSKRRHNLWKEDPHCHWCGVLTKFEGAKKDDPAKATKDHLKEDRPYQGGFKYNIRTTQTVLACQRCNQERGIIGL